MIFGKDECLDENSSYGNSRKDVGREICKKEKEIEVISTEEVVKES